MSSIKDVRNSAVDSGGEPKKVYGSPVLHVYGDMRSLTSAVGNMGGLDGMGGLGMANSLP